MKKRFQPDNYFQNNSYPRWKTVNFSKKMQIFWGVKQCWLPDGGIPVDDTNALFALSIRTQQMEGAVEGAWNNANPSHAWHMAHISANNTNTEGKNIHLEPPSVTQG